MSEAPAPMVPDYCDLRGFLEWSRFFGERVFKSHWYQEALNDPRGGIAALKLWWTAMLECPAGSLPNDERWLCRMADFGQDIRSWRKHRATAMHGFVLCADGRWYHPFLADEARSAWERRQQAERDRGVGRDRMRRWRGESGLSAQAWDDLREAVFARDGRQCVDCGSTYKLHCDHIVPLTHGGTNDTSNLATRCVTCHGRKTAKQQNPRKRNDVTAHNGECEPLREPAGEPAGEPSVSRHVSSRAREEKRREEKKEPSPNPSHGRGSTPAAPGTPQAGRRSNGTNPRENGTNPRAAPRRDGFVSGGIAVLADRLRERAEARKDDDLTDERTYFAALQIVEGNRG